MTLHPTIMKLKPIHRTGLIAFGVLLFFAGLWGGSWLCGRFPIGNTYDFAAVATSFAVVVAGIITIIFGTLLD